MNSTIEAVNALCHFASRANLRAFCDVIGNVEDDYAQEKFKDFQQMCRLLGRFDDNVLTKLAEAGREGDRNAPPSNCPNCNGEREWGVHNQTTVPVCMFCGRMGN